MASKSSKQRKKRRRNRQSPERAAKREPAAEGSTEPARARAAERKRSAATDERPPAPWGSFPLVELSVLVGIIMLVVGLVLGPGGRGQTFLFTGLVLASIGGVELSIREHFAGYRSHTAVLAGLPAAIVLGVLFFFGPDGLPTLARVVVAATVFAAAALLLTRVFRARSGGLPFKFGGFGRG